VLNDEVGNLMGAILSDAQKLIWPKDIMQLVQDLKDTAESLGEGCAGLASNQIWDKDTPPPAVFVVRFNTPDGGKWQEFINPEVRTSGKSVVHEESCFSKPGCKPKLKKRKMNVSVTFQTLTERKAQHIKLFYKDTFAPIVFQHEYDHLCGKLI
jgi:peptide deformylase